MITYKTKDTHPGTVPTATIYLDGLLCFSFDDAKKCTIGVNRAVGSGHKWNLSVVNLKNRKNILERNQENTGDLREVLIDVTGGAMGGAYVYNGRRQVSLPIDKERRFNLENSWIDLEGERGHNQHFENDAKTIWPRFTINEGLFCAGKLSKASYELRDNNPTPLIKPLGKIALQIVADIFLDPRNPRSKIEINLPDMKVSLNHRSKYQIFITNNCASKRVVDIDFPLHYQAFSAAFNGKRGKMKTNDQFHLVYNNGQDAAASNFARASDRAPCMGAVFGQTSAFKT